MASKDDEYDYLFKGNNQQFKITWRIFVNSSWL